MTSIKLMDKKIYGYLPGQGNTLLMEASIHVGKDGWFSTEIPEPFLSGVNRELTNKYGIERFNREEGFKKCGSQSLEDLFSFLRDVAIIAKSPTVTETPVIRYNLESHISFAEDNWGTIYPNAGFPGASWNTKDHSEKKYGGHHACSPCVGGYSMIVGARADKKITYNYESGKQIIKYERYYGTGSHHCNRLSDHPAAVLNSWCSFTLPEKAKEMPYTDEAARFFHKLLLGMAEMQRALQKWTSDPKDCERLANSGELLVPEWYDL